jgi:hypothetical protein
MGGTYSKNGRTKDSEKGLKRKLPYCEPVRRPRTRWTDVVKRDSRQLLGMWGWRGVKLQIGMNGSVLWGRPRTGRGCSAMDGLMDPVPHKISLVVYCAFCIWLDFNSQMFVKYVLNLFIQHEHYWKMKNSLQSAIYETCS